MIIVNGDLLESPLRIIAHQVNCKGVMGGGIARQLRWEYTGLFEEYQKHIKDCDNPLGSYYLFRAKNENKEILNIFGQEMDLGQINNILIIKRFILLLKITF